MYQYSCKNDDIVGSLQNQILEVYVIVILQIIMFYYAFIVLTIDVIYPYRASGSSELYTIE